MKPVKPSIGGQAVIEGVMMRGPQYTAIAVRKGKDIVVKREENQSLQNRYPFLRLPVIRGVLALFEMLVIGISALSYSASIAEEEEYKLTPKDIAFSIIIAVGFAIALFIVLPTFLIRFFENNVKNPILLNLIEGIIRIIIFFLYIFSISIMKDIRRFFEYHGAEHMAVHCYENGDPLTVENAKKYKTLHPRCGTSFLLIVMIVSILLFSFLGWPGILLRILSRIILLPLVAGISYELIRFTGRSDSKIAKIISAPGMWLQLLTTRKPDDSQIEVALEALKSVI
ncbi:MAG: DUF1385 domain-containing protein [Thermovenabulum sp.]|uniref:DUF1385 domain-containing protein n=1 Tax=Thermovenabulum sp. TaxID=3100335 RepID=UPI003C79B457